MSELSNKKYYVTTPIYYVNGAPHVGTALTTIACDVLTRYQRLHGREAFLLTGTDENATKVQEAAQKAGVPTMEYVDGLAAEFERCWQYLHIEANAFERTTSEQHKRATHIFFERLREKGYVYSGVYEGWYSVSDETFFRDSEVKDGIAIESGKPVVRAEEQNYFFKLSAFGDRLLEHIEANPEFLLPEFRRNEVIGFIKEGLRDMSIARPTRGWGMPVPGEPQMAFYVWFDALITYLSGTGWPDSPDWQTLWPADVHFMGKEIFVRFHATLWPAMLMALDLPLPKQVYGHGFWTIPGLKEGEKAGKSTGGLPHPIRFAEFIAERSGAQPEIAADAVRYLLCREMNFGLDTLFTVENCLRRFNTDLANDLGNLLNRTINMMVKYYDGVVPEAEHDPEIAALALQVREDYTRALAGFQINGALEAAWKLVARMNKYIDEKAPWTLAKAANNGDADSKAALATVLTACLEATHIVAILMQPFMPVASVTILRQLGIANPEAALTWDALHTGRLPAGTQVGPPVPIFPRIQELTADADALMNLSAPISGTKENTNNVSETNVTPAPGTPVAPPEPTAGTELITIDDFMKVELKAAEILAAEPVPNATKLLRLTVQVGEEDTRTILAGIAEYYAPEELVGRQVVIVANLQPRKMRGIESQGMLLAADLDGRAVMLKPDQVVPNGSRVR